MGVTGYKTMDREAKKTNNVFKGFPNIDADLYTKEANKIFTPYLFYHWTRNHKEVELWSSCCNRHGAMENPPRTVTETELNIRQSQRRGRMPVVWKHGDIQSGGTSRKEKEAPRISSRCDPESKPRKSVCARLLGKERLSGRVGCSAAVLSRRGIHLPKWKRRSDRACMVRRRVQKETSRRKIRSKPQGNN